MAIQIIYHNEIKQFVSNIIVIQMEQAKQSKLGGQNFEQSIQSKDEISLLCRLCDDFIAKAVVTCCGHTFCQLCLSQYMLFLDECPQCREPVRNQKINYNILLDAFIKDYLKKQQQQCLEGLELKLNKIKQHNLKKKVKDVVTGQRLDIRDGDYVWCSGQVTRTLNKWQQKKVKYMIVKYDHNGKKEELPENSPRLAIAGFYTSRTDIPRYFKGALVYQKNSIIKKVPYLSQEQEKSNSDE